MSEPAQEIVRRTPLPFDPVGKTHYTAEESRPRRGGSPAGRREESDRACGHPDRPATQEELMAFVEELWALYRAETENAGDAG